jgi:4'-phosphopantetheinyl transferase
MVNANKNWQVETWQQVTIVPTLLHNALHLWYLHLSDTINLSSIPSKTCSEIEYARANKFKSLLAQTRFLYIRNWLRQIISGYVNTTPQQVKIDYNDHGKPFIAYPQPAPYFNLSHSGISCVLAVYWKSPIGIDIELIRPRIGMKQIASRFFTNSIVNELNSLSGDMQVYKFYYYWTQFEAKLKAHGDSIFGMNINDARIEIESFMPATNIQAAIATQGTLPSYDHWHTLQFSFGDY